jgi:multidrug transporter EmrE-like cation transporter
MSPSPTQSSPTSGEFSKALQYCAISALLGTLGSAAAKYNLQYSQLGASLQAQCEARLSYDTTRVPLLPPDLLQRIGLEIPLLLPFCITFVGILVKIIQLGMTLGLNTWGLSYSLRASHMVPTSITVTICNGFAFIINAVLGVVLFQEVLSQRFFLGLIVILVGLGLICHDQIKQMGKDPGGNNEDKGKKDGNGEKKKIEQIEQIEQNNAKNDEKKSILQIIHEFFEPLEDRPIETFIFGVLIGLAVLTLSICWVLLS